MVSGRLCQAAEGRGTQCLARPPGGTGSSGAQGPWSEYAAKPQLAAPKGGYGPAQINPVSLLRHQNDGMNGALLVQ